MKKYILRNKKLFMVTIIIIMLSSALSILFAFVLKDILDLFTIEADINTFFKTILYSGFFIIFTGIVTFLKRYVKAYYTKDVLISLKNDVFKSILNYSVTNFYNKKTGDYVSNLTNDIRLIENNYINNLLGIFEDGITFIIAVIALFNLNMYLAITTAIVSIIPMMIPKFTYKKMASFSEKYSVNAEIFTSKIKDLFSGFEVIKGFNLQKQILEEYNKVNYQFESTKCKVGIFRGGVYSVSNFFSYAMQMITIVVGVYLALKNIITVGSIVAAGQLMNYILSPLTEIASKINGIKATAPIIKKVENLSIKGDIEVRKTNKKTFDEKIVFNNVSFFYDNKKKGLNNFSYEFKKGKKYAIVGESGSGKSTLLKLILNYYNNYSGSILIDKLNIKDIDPDDLYKLVAIMHQNIFLFDSTIRDNITLFKKYNEEAIKKVITRSGLEEFINLLEFKENTLIGQAGNHISGGEKQRIAIARALLRKTPILLLDEATSSLDNRNAYSIEKSILDLNDITVIAVSHRLTKKLLQAYDSILVLKNGCLIEEGNFAELIKQKGYFYSMYYYYSLKEMNIYGDDLSELCI